MAAFYKEQLGMGIYTVPDISRLLHLPQAKVRRYINKYWDEKLGKSLFNETYSWSAGNNIKAVNFYTLIELYTCFQLQELGVSIQQILKSRIAIAKELKSPYPFASEKLLSDGKKIWYQFKDCIVKADGSNQIDFVDFITQFASNIEFNSASLAEKFWPAGKNSAIVIDPHHQFGQPVLNGTNINAQVIFSMYESGEQRDTIGILYDLTPQQVNDAIVFYKRAVA